MSERKVPGDHNDKALSTKNVDFVLFYIFFRFNIIFYMNPDKAPLILTEENIDQFEKAAIQHSHNTLISIENAIKAWNSSKDKPKRLKEKFLAYKKLHDNLARWERKAKLLQRQRASFYSRLVLLKEFTRICRSYGEN